MNLVFSLREDQAGLWSIRLGSVVLFRQLQLAPAIHLARELARDGYYRSGHPVTVEMPGPDVAIELASYHRGDVVHALKPCGHFSASLHH